MKGVYLSILKPKSMLCRHFYFKIVKIFIACLLWMTISINAFSQSGQWVWMKGDTLSFTENIESVYGSLGVAAPTCSHPEARPSENTFYQLTGTTENGCIQLDTVKIYLDIKCKLFIADAFSPNNDNINDIYYVRSNCFEEIPRQTTLIIALMLC